MKLIDISQILNNETPIYPGDYNLSLTKSKTLEEDCYTSYILSSSLHTGTHIDIPMHLVNDDRLISDFALENFIGKGVLLDVRGEKTISMKPCYKEMIKEGNIVLLYTSFDQHYKTEEYFTEHPVVSAELGNFLISKKIKVLGMDMPSPDYPPFTFHKALLSNDIFILENLTNLQELVGISDFEVITLPLKLSAEASLVRAICRVN
jgi:kynurenine formamidase